ncbi:putative nuclease of restriction endonuclease-like (RecB) superfamily [Flavobacterium sp. PL11]|jgi:predicted nuclease of restriction endonuclease-like (RecB) superfamily|uniref:PDDEXK nuclease domain-containing protein n=1 Tax=Flavobacterium sp. PL11 TaxID=3071717 RepID=UPI002DFA289A|nr:putative nuclease of restriction endonuclease-like (RecB) superfamily [Flavobacterium sp. PL11]
MSENLHSNSLFSQVVDLLQQSNQQVVRAINQTMVYTYYEIGRMIVEEEQNGKDRAEYGKQLLKGLSKELNKEFGKGFSVETLERIRRFYLTYSKSSTLSTISESEKLSEVIASFAPGKKALSHNISFLLSWSHYNFLMRMDDANERSFYEIETAKNNWSVRELKRQYDTALYTRLALSRDKEGILKLSQQGQIIEKPKDVIKDPYILEFLGLPELNQYSENELEEEIINKLEHFLLELGNGFTFVARQKRITFEDKHFRIDLVFYNRILKCFVLIDLKIGELKHQDLGQMQMYVNYYDREMRLEEENKTIGLVLCQNKSDLVVEYTLPENNEQIFASKYKMVLPSKEEFIHLIEQI